MGEKSAKNVADIIAAALRENGIEVGRVNGDDRSRFARVPVRMPNGQVFDVQIEEMF